MTNQPTRSALEGRGVSEPFAPSVRTRDLLFTNATIVDVVLQSTYRGWFTVEAGRFVEVEAGDPSEEQLAALDVTERVDLGGAWVQPGMIDAHMHIESSLITPRRFAETALKRGTTTILQDPHEVANVLGAPGIEWMMHASRGLPLRIYSAISSCVPATSADIETPNASITAEEVTALAANHDVIALGEVMDFRGLIMGNPHLSGIVAAGARSGISLEGHVPSLSGPELSRYVAHGIRSDHTLASPAKLLEELRKGLWVMIQEKSLTSEVVAEIMRLPDRSRVMLITDDVMPDRLLSGHMDRLVRVAVEQGWAPLDAVAAATLRPASYLGFHDLGLIAPGARADFLVMDGELVYPPRDVYVNGEAVVTGGEVVPFKAETPGGPAGVRTSFGLRGVTADALRFGGTGRGHRILRARVIEVNQVNSFTTLAERDVTFKDGVPEDQDLALACVIPRAALTVGAAGAAGATDGTGAAGAAATGSAAAGAGVTDPYQPVVCLVAGFGLKHGGYATSFAHDSHNFFLLGRDPEAMHAALSAVVDAGGGMAFAGKAGSGAGAAGGAGGVGGAIPDAPTGGTNEPQTERPLTLLPLPLAGQLSDEPAEQVGATFARLEQELRAAGVGVKAPILLLTLLSLSVSPDFKVTDKGIVDVQARRILAPEVEE